MSCSGPFQLITCLLDSLKMFRLSEGMSLTALFGLPVQAQPSVFRWCLFYASILTLLLSITLKFICVQFKILNVWSSVVSRKTGREKEERSYVLGQCKKNIYIYKI